MNVNDFYEARNSVYCYDNSNILINKFNIKDGKELLKIERKIVLMKLYELRQNNIIGDFSIEHFISIHRFLFEDIYPFAGLFRRENIAKDNFRFAEYEYIESELRKLLKNLKDDNFLVGISKEELASKLTYYMSELNVLHPFREGNGRTTREFIRQIAYNAGYVLDMKDTNPKEFLNACIKSVAITNYLEKIIYDCLKKRD